MHSNWISGRFAPKKMKLEYGSKPQTGGMNG